MDCFTDKCLIYSGFLYVSGPGNITVAVYGVVRDLSDFIKNILICVPKMNEGLIGLERHEDE